MTTTNGSRTHGKRIVGRLVDAVDGVGERG
jgi:hypothetical protein